MVPWGLLLGGAAWVIFPHHKGTILAVGAMSSVLRIRSKRNCAIALPSVLTKANGTNGLEPKSAKFVDDGEAYSESGIKKVQLDWSDLNCELHKRKKGVVQVKKILDNVSGKAFPGRLLAIMGPSGSGKTSLLCTLAGQVPKSDGLKLTGSLTINNQCHSASTHRQAFVRQDDVFYSQLTVRETLTMAAKLQLPRSMSEEDKEKHIMNLMQHLGLSAVADTIVGDEKTRGISGGERKRLSIACELIAAPSVVFADEPTTGLDAFQAKTVMEALCGLAKDGHTVICSIHQPRSDIYNMFNDIILLASGQVVYAGAANDTIAAYFASLGYACPAQYNPAEFFSDLISVNFSTIEKEVESKIRLARLIEAFHTRRVPYFGFTSGLPYSEENSFAQTEGRVSVGDGLTLQREFSSGCNDCGSSWWMQFKLLLIRSWRQVTRDKATNIIRGMMTATSALIFGAIYWQMSLAQTSIQDRMGLLQVAAVNTAMASLTKTVNAFPRERSVVNRERVRGGYDILPYFLSKLVAEMPISALFPLGFSCLVYPMTGLHKSFKRFFQFLSIVTLESFTSSALGLTVGAVVPSTEAALALGPMVMLIFIVFGGYYVNTANTSKMFQWIPNISLIKWGFEAMCVNEFRGLTFVAKGKSDISRGEQVLERLSFDKSTLSGALCSEARILGSLYLITLFLLSNNKPRFQPLLPNPSSPSTEHDISNRLQLTPEVDIIYPLPVSSALSTSDSIVPFAVNVVDKLSGILLTDIELQNDESVTTLSPPSSQSAVALDSLSTPDSAAANEPTAPSLLPVVDVVTVDKLCGILLTDANLQNNESTPPPSPVSSRSTALDSLSLPSVTSPMDSVAEPDHEASPLPQPPSSVSDDAKHIAVSDAVPADSVKSDQLPSKEEPKLQPSSAPPPPLLSVTSSMDSIAGHDVGHDNPSDTDAAVSVTASINPLLSEQELEPQPSSVSPSIPPSATVPVGNGTRQDLDHGDSIDIDAAVPNTAAIDALPSEELKNSAPSPPPSSVAVRVENGAGQDHIDHADSTDIYTAVPSTAAAVDSLPSEEELKLQPSSALPLSPSSTTLAVENGAGHSLDDDIVGANSVPNSAAVNPVPLEEEPELSPSSAPPPSPSSATSPVEDGPRFDLDDAEPITADPVVPTLAVVDPYLSEEEPKLQPSPAPPPSPSSTTSPVENDAGHDLDDAEHIAAATVPQTTVAVDSFSLEEEPDLQSSSAESAPPPPSAILQVENDRGHNLDDVESVAAGTAMPGTVAVDPYLSEEEPELHAASALPSPPSSDTLAVENDAGHDLEDAGPISVATTAVDTVAVDPYLSEEETELHPSSALPSPPSSDTLAGENDAGHDLEDAGPISVATTAVEVDPYLSEEETELQPSSALPFLPSSAALAVESEAGNGHDDAEPIAAATSALDSADVDHADHIDTDTMVPTTTIDSPPSEEELKLQLSSVSRSLSLSTLPVANGEGQDVEQHADTVDIDITVPTTADVEDPLPSEELKLEPSPPPSSPMDLLAQYYQSLGQ